MLVKKSIKFIKTSLGFMLFWFLQYLMFEEKIQMYWLSSFILYITFNLFSTFALNRVKTSQLVFFNWLLILNFWLINICVLTNCFLNEFSFFVLEISEKSMYREYFFGSLLYLDLYAIIFVVLINSIALYVFTYSHRYLIAEPTNKKFYICINGFTIGMILLVSANSLICFVLGWELIGWFSFFLICNYQISHKTQVSSFKVLCFNKFSDTGVFLTLIVLVISQTNEIIILNSFWDHLSQINSQDTKSIHLYYIVFGFIIASMIKSAHFGFHLWLPDSMEAPIPASALIHSATLVSAGIYVFGRISPLLIYFPSIFQFVLLWASFTAFSGALMASYQTDFKKTLAYSTISHCGFLMALAVLPNHVFLYVYLVVHGVLKSFSFLICGDLILKNSNYQDWRKSGSLLNCSKLKLVLLGLSVSGLAGLPFGVGFYGKHYFMGEILSSTTTIGFLTKSFFILAAILGVIYTVRINFYVFFGRKNGLFNHYLLLNSFSYQNFCYFNSLKDKTQNLKKSIWWLSWLYVLVLYILSLSVVLGLTDLSFCSNSSIFSVLSFLQNTYFVAYLNSGVLGVNLYLVLYTITVGLCYSFVSSNANHLLKYMVLVLFLSNLVWFVVFLYVLIIHFLFI